jgi:hypothetical protein
MHKIIARRLEFVEALVRQQFLAQHVMTVRLSPWTLNGDSV